MAVDDSGGEVDELAVVNARARTQHLKRGIFVDRMTLHQDPLGTFDQRSPAERSLKFVIFGEATQDDVDRALPVLNIVIGHVGKHSPFGGFPEEAWIRGVQERDHGARRFADDLVDQLQRVLGAITQPYERDVGSFPVGHGTDVLDFDLPGYDFVAERGHDLSYQREAVLALVCDQDTQMLSTVRPRLHNWILSHETGRFAGIYAHGETRIRTGDTTIFSRVLYQLSYLAAPAMLARLVS